jgi:hypothetical protein
MLCFLVKEINTEEPADKVGDLGINGERGFLLWYWLALNGIKDDGEKVRNFRQANHVRKLNGGA